MSIRQWDTDWFDQFKKILATDLTTLMIRPGTPLWWAPRRDVAYGQKQTQSAIRRPDQRVHVSRDVEYYDKFADRIVAVRDLASITDSIRIDEEYYAGDPVNALGHVSDLTKNWPDAFAQTMIVGTANDPLTYGLIDGGAGTGSTSTARPDACDDVTTNGAWDVTTNIIKDLADMEEELSSKGFKGPRIIGTHNLVKPYLNLPITNTAVNAGAYAQSAFGYQWDLSEWYDSNATKDVVDVFMIDASAHEIHQTPLMAKAFWDEKTENYYWRWKTRAYFVSNPIHDGTDWNKGIVKCTVDLIT